MALGSTPPLTERNTRNIFWRVNAASAKGCQTLPPASAECLEMGGNSVPTQPGQRPVTIWVYKPEGCKYSLELLMMSGMPLETCWAFKKNWNNKFYYKVASCWLFLIILGTFIRKTRRREEKLILYVAVRMEREVLRR